MTGPDYSPESFPLLERDLAAAHARRQAAKAATAQRIRIAALALVLMLVLATGFGITAWLVTQ